MALCRVVSTWKSPQNGYGEWLRRQIGSPNYSYMQSDLLRKSNTLVALYQDMIGQPAQNPISWSYDLIKLLHVFMCVPFMCVYE